jgi:hypothetical protein
VQRALTTIALALCAWPTSASAGPTKLSAQWTRGESIHLAGQRGAINRRASIKLGLELLAGGKLKGADTGSISEHNLYETFSTTEATSWTNTWSGAWTIRGTAAQPELVLDLVLDARRCTRTKTTSGAAPEQLACEAVSKQIQLACTTEQIDVGDPAAPARKPAREGAWRCAPTGAADLADTPSTWVLGKSTCLQANGGRGGTSYQRCVP